MTTRPAPPAPASVAPARFAGLDGLRALAVGAVLVYHLTPGALPGGYIGVDMFFVISGFLITALLLRERERTGRISVGMFWRRRARRLLPALGLLLIACSTAAWVIGGDVLVGLGRQLLGALTFSGNWLAVFGQHSYFDSTSPELFRNLWSLAVEEQFYLVWPLLFIVLLRAGSARRRLIVAGIAVASAVAMAVLYVPGADATRVYYGTDTHSFGLAIGALLALATRDWTGAVPKWRLTARVASAVVAPVAAVAALAGLAGAALFMPDDAPFAYRGGLVAVALLTAVTIAATIAPGSRVGRMLDAGPMRWVGERSYGLYLWHWPVFTLVLSALPAWPRDGASGWALGGIALAVTVAAAAFSYRFVEQPVRVLGFRAAIGGAFAALPAPRTMIARVAVVALIAGGVAGTSAALVASPYRSDAQAEIEQGQDAIADAPAPPPASSPGDAAPGVAAALPGGDQITAIGDSVMLASAPELQAAFPGIQIDAVVSRQLAQAPAIVEALKAQGALRPIVLLGLGTNGPIERATLESLLDAMGPGHEVVVVNVQAPRGWTDGVNAELTGFAGQHRRVELANWRDAIAGQLSLLSRDQIHPGNAGGAVYATAVRDALQRLAELPPLLRPDDYGLAPRPE